MRSLTVPSTAIALRSDRALTPAMTAAVWEISDALDRHRVPARVPNAVWLEIPARRLRGAHGRTDNVWLRACLERLTGVTVTGEHGGNPWGAVVLAEWHITEGGSLVRLLVPPTGVQALRAPQTFARIEEHAAHRLTGHGRRLYALLADRRRQRRPSWEYGLGELRALMGVDDRKAYRVWSQFNRWVLKPAVAAVNDYGTVSVRMTPRKLGRSVAAVRLDWSWKDLRDAAETAAENERHPAARRRRQGAADAPPLIPGAPGPPDPREARLRREGRWWDSLPEDERAAWRARIGPTYTLEGPGGMLSEIPNREQDFAARAHREVFGDGGSGRPDPGPGTGDPP